ncbi:hypothetical protein OJAV_G00135380 [Oryzias javanicus]|uniref:Uncharacterized protein n=1 Tax=Oryzias javanicus TaxID=123683 RepID=A0A437CKR5_ORYJA|nr:hypothetical protein OJAV_G00135380 [Oryzias javanicus]
MDKHRLTGPVQAIGRSPTTTLQLEQNINNHLQLYATFGLFQTNNSLEVKGTSHYHYYVWDNVAIAFHVRKKVLKFDVDQLRQNLKDCELDSVTYNFTDKLTAEQAKKLIRDLWPESPVENLPRHTGDGEAPPLQPPS